MRFRGLSRFALPAAAIAAMLAFAPPKRYTHPAPGKKASLVRGDHGCRLAVKLTNVDLRTHKCETLAVVLRSRG